MTTPEQDRSTTPPASESPQDPAPSSSNATSSNGTRAPMLGVRATRSKTGPASSAPAPSAAGAPAGEPRPPADPLDNPDGTRSASDRPGRDAPKPLRIGKRTLADIIRGGVMSAGEGLHYFLARTEPEQAAGVWLFEDEREAGEIADPLTNATNRYVGGVGELDAMTGDLIAAGLAAAGYVIKNAVRAFRARRAARSSYPAGYLPADNPNNDEGTDPA